MKKLDFIPDEVQKRGWRKQTNPIPRENKKIPMTQIVGIVYQEGILVASESQYTAGRQKTFDAEKISIVKFKNGDVIVAECGVVSTSNRAVRYFTEAAKDAEIDSEDAVSKIIESVIKKIRLEILESLQERPYSAPEQDEIFNSDNVASLFWSGLGLGCVGAILLYFARLPLYRQRRYFTFGPKALPPSHRKTYWLAYAFVIASVFLLSVVWLRTG